MVTIDDFAKLEFKVGTVLEVEDIGEENPRQVLSGIKQWYAPEDLIGKQFVFIANLEPRIMMGLESQGMVMATDSDEGPVLLIPEKQVPPGSKIR